MCDKSTFVVTNCFIVWITLFFLIFFGAFYGALRVSTQDDYGCYVSNYNISNSTCYQTNFDPYVCYNLTLEINYINSGELKTYTKFESDLTEIQLKLELSTINSTTNCCYDLRTETISLRKCRAIIIYAALMVPMGVIFLVSIVICCCHMDVICYGFRD